MSCQGGRGGGFLVFRGSFGSIYNLRAELSLPGVLCVQDVEEYMANIDF